MGSYWPDNIARGQRNHNSTILLIDQVSSKISSVVEADEVNAYRTAAAGAVAATVLARAESSTLTIFGAAHQALFECFALSRVLPIKDLLIVARDPVKAQQFPNQAERVRIGRRCRNKCTESLYAGRHRCNRYSG